MALRYGLFSKNRALKRNQSRFGVGQRLSALIGKLTSYGFMLFVFLLALSLVRSVESTISSEARIEKERDEIEELKRTNDELKKQLEEKQSTYYEEKQLRDQLGLAKPGEIVAVLPEDATVSSQSYSSFVQPFYKSNWRKWLEKFM